MSRIQTVFANLASTRKRGLIPFITAGFPDEAATLALMHSLVRAGADIIELGVPFSDPAADGPVIQRASEHALRQGMSLSKVLLLLAAFRETDALTPVVLMGYTNPVEAMGYEVFVEQAALAGVDGLLLVDSPPEANQPFSKSLKQVGIEPIFLLAPTSTPQRIQDVSRQGGGFVYYVSLKGVTGSSALNLQEVAARLPAIRASIGLPVAIGFGIRDADTVQRLGKLADAVVVGSRILEEIEKSPPQKMVDNVALLVSGLRQALDQIEEAS